MMGADLIEGLCRPRAYSHDIDRVDVRETHISWVLLTGEYAYKVKKPVDLGFVDFTSLERRRHFCEEEIRLNRSWVDDLYLGVVPISGTPQHPAVDGQGQAIEFAVKMRQFPEAGLFGRMLQGGELNHRHIDQLARVVSQAHSRVAKCRELDSWGTPEKVWAPAQDNFDELRRLLSGPDRQALLAELERWTVQSFARHRSEFMDRRQEGKVRECHGDLHLGNIVLWRGRASPFDCIEFNPELRWIDVLNDVAFLVMDLDDHRRGDLAHRFLNRYLEHTGDYAGLAVFRFYRVYRAMVRAKVDALRLQQQPQQQDERRRLIEECSDYLALAEGYTQPTPVMLSITHGVSGSGKTLGTEVLVEREGAIRLRSDLERKRLAGVGPEFHDSSGVGEGMYSAGASDRTYQRLHDLARRILRSRHNVIVDATFLLRPQREAFHQLAIDEGAGFRILPFSAPEPVLHARIAERLREGTDASDATPAVLESQLGRLEPLTTDEMAFVTSRAGPDRVPGLTPDS